MEYTLAVVGLVFLLLAFSHWGSDLILIGAVLLLLLGGVIETKDARPLMREYLMAFITV